MADIYNKTKGGFLLGTLLNNAELIFRKEYPLDKSDFTFLSHKIIYVCIVMLANNGVREIDSKEIGTMLQAYPAQLNTLVDELNDWVGYIESIKKLGSIDSFDYYYNSIRKYSLLRKYSELGISISKFWDYEKSDEENNANLEKHTIKDIVSYYDIQINELKNSYISPMENTETIVAGSGFEEFLDEMEKEPLWGNTFLSEYLNTLTRGLIKGQLCVMSSPTGSGKSTVSIATLCNLCATELWNETTQQYEPNPCKTINGGLFIEFELELVTEITTKFIAYISNIPTNQILDGFYDTETRARLDKANQILLESNIHLVYLPNFTTKLIEEKIKEHKDKYNIDMVVYDYIQEGAELSGELQRANGGVGLRNDQVLTTLASFLKDMARKYDIIMYSMTQCNANLAVSDIVGAECIAGSRAVANKVDLGGLFLPIRTKEEKLIDEFQSTIGERRGLNKYRPSHIYHMYKMRFSQYPMNSKVWVYVDLGTGRMKDYIVTDCYNKPIKVNPTQLLANYEIEE